MKKLIILSVVLIILDQITKYIFTGKEYLIGMFGINYVENTGAAFGILKGMDFLFIIVGLGVIIAIFYYYKKFEYKFPLILILAGTIGNLIDRIAFGFVKDFIMIWKWPIFNVADICNTIGVLLLAFYFLREEKIYKQRRIKR